MCIVPAIAKQPPAGCVHQLCEQQPHVSQFISYKVAIYCATRASLYLKPLQHGKCAKHRHAFDPLYERHATICYILTPPLLVPLHTHRLWQAVTKVQRGQRLGDATSDWSECTVEDLVRILHALPASASAVQAAGPGLAYLDSRAAAALFKGLAKSGLGHRAVELFDYLR